MLRDYITQDLFIGLLLFCLTIVVLTSQLFSARFADFIAVIYNDKYTKLYARERKKLDVFNIFLLLNLIISAGIFLFITYQSIFEYIEQNYTVFLIFGLLFLILILKRIIERVIGYFIDHTDIIKHHIFRKATYLNISGILLLAFNVILLFGNVDKEVVIYLVSFLVITINLIGFIRFLKDYQNLVISNLFYFLLYLCALEIGPYVILYKVIKDYFV